MAAAQARASCHDDAGTTCIEDTMLNPQPPIAGSNDRPPDVRDIIQYADSIGQLARIDGADWNLEIGVLAEIFAHSHSGRAPAVLFDRIKGYPAGMRIVSGLHNSCRRLAYAFGFPQTDDPTVLVKAYRDRMKSGFCLIPPVTVAQGPILDNVDRDAAVDLFKFPVPMIHEKDGGRYIGTYDLVIMKDPDTGWVNLGTYRAVAHDRDTIGVWISPGKHGRLIRDKYFARSQPCPVLICCGQDPVLFLAGSHEIKHGVSEFAYAGGHRGRPYETIASELHGLPMPAHAEIVLEGEFLPDERRAEGPFGEFTGYYASHVREEPVMRVRRAYYRNDPILTMASPMRPPTDVSFAKCVVQSGMIWDEIESAGLSGVRAVWCHEAGAVRMFVVVAIEQLHPGHAQQAGMLVAGCHSGNYAGRWVVVVDHDIDPSNLEDVIWAMSTRCDPVADIEYIKRAWSTPLDPLLREPPWESTRAIVNACRPWDWRHEFPAVASASPELRKQVEEKWAHEILAAVGRK
jgi:UbiD family decarboxylase